MPTASEEEAREADEAREQHEKYERLAAREAEIEYEEEVPAEIAGTPFALFRARDIWERLAAHPDTRPHISDAGFRAGIERLRTLSSQGAAREAMEDPRLMQAVMAMHGEGRLKLNEDELAQAEVGGRMRRRDPIQFVHMERAYAHTTVETAKEAGNEHFKKGAYSDAAACYQRALALAKEEDSGLAVRVTLLSNSAAAFLKLRRPEEACQCCRAAAQLVQGLSRQGHASGSVADVGMEAVEVAVMTKVHYRLSQALAMRRDFGAAVVAAERAIAMATKSTDGEAAACDAGMLATLRREVERLKKLDHKARKEEREAALRKEREVQADALRGTGVPLVPDDGDGGRVGAEGKFGSAGRHENHGTLAVSTPRVARGYVQEVDFGFWAKTWLAEKLRGRTQHEGTCTIVVIGLMEAQSEIHASLKIKDGRRALFYDLTLICSWKGTVAPLSANHNMQGVIRLYNIGQETKYNPGGDKETSYMYELGFPQCHFGTTEPWAETIKTQAAELFHIICDVVQEWVAAFHKKASETKVG